MMPVLKMPSLGWKERLQQSASGGIKANLYNALVALRHAEELRDAIAWNEHRLGPEAVRPLPWDGAAPRWWTEADALHLTEWLQSAGIGVKLEIVHQAVQTVASERSHHPLRAWLEGLAWDGTPRVARWLSYYLGAEHTPYTSGVGQRWLISAVARVFRPGCKADHVLVLEGKQGRGKSSALCALVGERWFTDELADLGSKDAAIQMRGVWVIEMAELDHLGRSDVGRVKAFISRRSDRFRPPYGRAVVEAPRECVFAGTVNEALYLQDRTGDRRFWPVRTPAVDLAALRHDREQLWAEAVDLYTRGESWWPDTPELVAATEDEQAERRLDDAWLDKIGGFLGMKTRTSIGEVLGDCIGKKAGDWKRADEMRVAQCLNDLGWKRKRDPQPPRAWYYERPL